MPLCQIWHHLTRKKMKKCSDNWQSENIKPTETFNYENIKIVLLFMYA